MSKEDFDPETGLLTRQAFTKWGDRDIATSKAAPTDEPPGFAVIVFQPARVSLSVFSQVLRDRVRAETDVMGRVSEDAVSILVPEKPEGAERLVQRLRDSGREFQQAAIGHAAFPADGDNGEAVLQKAEMRLAESRQ